MLIAIENDGLLLCGTPQKWGAEYGVTMLYKSFNEWRAIACSPDPLLGWYRMGDIHHPCDEPVFDAIEDAIAEAAQRKNEFSLPSLGKGLAFEVPDNLSDRAIDRIFDSLRSLNQPFVHCPGGNLVLPRGCRVSEAQSIYSTDFKVEYRDREIFVRVDHAPVNYSLPAHAREYPSARIVAPVARDWKVVSLGRMNPWNGSPSAWRLDGGDAQHAIDLAIVDAIA